MRKLLFLFSAFAALAFLSCSNNDDMPCIICDSGSNEPMAYCLYRSGSYKCIYMGTKECKSTYDGESYGTDQTCGNYLGQQQNTSYSYCLYNSGSGGYVCNYVRDCKGGYSGENYGTDNTCGGYWWSSSSSVIPPPPSSSSAVMSSSSVNYCDINAYKKVEIGYKTWMAENYNCNVTGSRCYNGNTAQCNVYGRLYNWTTAMNIDKRYNKEEWGGSDERHQGICPYGWHIPSYEDWDDLLYSVGWPDGANLKATTGWKDSYYDDYEFSAMPGGYGYPSGNSYTYEDIGYSGRWWSATQLGEENVYTLLISYDNEYTEWDYEASKDNLYSVRCVRDY